MIYDDYDNEKKSEDYDSGYVNVGSSGTNAANRYEETAKVLLTVEPKHG